MANKSGYVAIFPTRGALGSVIEIDGCCEANVGGCQASGSTGTGQARWCGSCVAPVVLPGRRRSDGPRDAVSYFPRASRGQQDHAEPAAVFGGESGGIGEEEVKWNACKTVDWIGDTEK